MSLSAESRYKMNVRLSIKGFRANVHNFDTEKSERLDEIDCLNCISPLSIQTEAERLQNLVASATNSESDSSVRGVVVGSSLVYCFVINSDNDHRFMTELQRLLRQPRNLMKGSVVLDETYVSELTHTYTDLDIKYVKGAKFVVDVYSEPLSMQ